MERLHRSSPSAVYVRAVGIHQPRQACILDTGCLLWYIIFSEFNVCQQLEGSYLRAGQQTIEFAAVFPDAVTSLPRRVPSSTPAVPR